MVSSLFLRVWRKGKDLTVISVGKHNKYGHPAASTIQILRDKDIKVLRTDEDGEIEIVSDGKSWGVSSRTNN